MEKKSKIIRELTPKGMIKILPEWMNSCLGGLGCPAIFETDQDSYILIGKKLNPKDFNLTRRTAKDEILIEVPKKLIDKKN